MPEMRQNIAPNVFMFGGKNIELEKLAGISENTDTQMRPKQINVRLISSSALPSRYNKAMGPTASYEMNSRTSPMASYNAHNGSAILFTRYQAHEDLRTSGLRRRVLEIYEL